MNTENRYTLLDIIFRNGSVSRLTNNGISFDQISEFLNILIDEKLIQYHDEKISLSEKGLEELKKLEIIYKNTKKEEWIKPDEKSRIAKLEKNFIFVPKQNNLSF